MIEYFNVVTIIAELNNHGGVLMSYNFDTVRLYQVFDSSTSSGRFMWLLEFFVVAFYVWFFVEELLKCKRIGTKHFNVSVLSCSDSSPGSLLTVPCADEFAVASAEPADVRAVCALRVYKTLSHDPHRLCAAQVCARVGIPPIQSCSAVCGRRRGG